jgi:gamma-glutamylputrescine oxidase
MSGALHARTWYDDTAVAAPDCVAPDAEEGIWDVAIVGGGLAGLTALLTLAQAGARAVLFDARDIAAGASGRNGGFCTPGWAADEAQIVKVAGASAAFEMAALADEGVDWMRERMVRPGWQASGACEGVLTVSLSGRLAEGAEVFDRAALRDVLNAPRYRHATLSRAGVHFHPLNFMRLLASDALAAGGRIATGVAVHRLAAERRGWQVETSAGRHVAKQVIWAGGGYGGGEAPWLTSRVLPIRTYIGVSDPMSDLLDRHIRTPYAIGDTRRAGNYYRRLPDGRLLWGMAITAFGTLDEGRVKAMVADDIRSIYPGLAADMREAGAGIAYGWAGNMAYAPHFLPIVGEVRPGFHALTGFGGHGMNTAPAAALALTDRLTGAGDRLGPFTRIPRPLTVGLLGRLAAEASYRWRILQDHRAEQAET